MTTRARAIVGLVLAGGALGAGSGSAEAARPSLYVANADGSSISHYARLGNGLLSPLGAPAPSGTGPQNVAVTPDGRFAYAANFNGNSVSEFSVRADGALVPLATAAAGTNPTGVAVSPDGGSVYATNFSGGGVSQYDVASDGLLSPKSPPTAPAGTNPISIALSPGGRSAFVANRGSATVSQYTVTGDGRLVPETPATVPSGAVPYSVAVEPGGRSAYVANRGSSSISQYDLSNGRLTLKTPATVATLTSPDTLAISPDGASAYVTDSGAARVSQYSIGNGGRLAPKATRDLAVGGDPRGITLSPDGRYAYMAWKASSKIGQYSVGAGGQLVPRSPTPIDAGSGPQGLAASPTQGPTAAFNAPSPEAGHPVTFDGSGSRDPDGSVARYDWDFEGDAEGANGGPRPTHTYAKAGTYTATLEVTDNEGCSTDRVFTGQTAYCNGSLAARLSRQVVVHPDVTRPVLTKLSIGRRWALGRGRTARSAVRRGTRIRFRLSEKATVRLRFERPAKGRRQGRRCRRPSRRLRNNRRCTRWVKVFSISRKSKQGRNSFRFTGRVGKRKLRPGRYRVVAVATDVGHNRSRAKRRGFRVVRRR